MHHSLVSSPTEIILRIADQLDAQSLTQLRLVCRELVDILTPFVFQTVSLYLMPKYPKESLESVQCRLSACSTPSTRVYKSAKHLAVHSSAPLCPIDKLPQDMLSSLWSAIENMKGLKSLKLVWVESAYQKPVMFGVQEKVVGAVAKATGGRLQRLIISAPLPYRIPGAIVHFRGLEEFRLIAADINCYCYTLRPYSCLPEAATDVVQQIIDANPDLLHLTLGTPCKRSFFNATKLFDRKSNIGSLHIDGVECPTLIQPLPLRSSLLNLQHLTIRSRIDKVNLSHFWASLQEARIPLKYLDTAQASKSLFDYLSSFRGLEYLAIKIHPKYLPQDAAHTFTSTILMKHADTLKSLSITVISSTDTFQDWHYTPSLWNPSFFAMSKLTTLSIHAPHTNALESEDFLHAMIKNYQEVITGVEYVSTLKCLTICWSEVVGGERDGYSRWMGKRDALVEDIALKLRSCGGRPAILKLRTGTYIAERGELGDGWVYRKKIAVGLLSCRS